MPDSPSAWLRSLAAEAQAGPWEVETRDGGEWWFGGGQDGMEAVIRPSSGNKWDYVAVRSGNTASDLATARLIALAPDLAVLCADAIDALEAIQLRRCNACDKPAKTWGPTCPGVVTGDMTHYHSADWWAQRALDRFAALQPKEPS